MRTDDLADPINQLYGEHDEALAQLRTLGRTGRTMAEHGVSKEVLSEFRSAIGFLENEIRDHNQWEEDNLFPLLERYLGPGGPCSVMRAEHRTLWETYQALEPFLRQAEAGSADASAVKRLAFLADTIVNLLSAHIQKENEILFPMARRMLTTADLQTLAAARAATAH